MSPGPEAPSPPPSSPPIPQPATSPPPAGNPPPSPRPRIEPIPPVVFDRVPWKRVLGFCVLAYGIFALFAAPFWFLPDGIASPLFVPVIAVAMWSPAIASLIMAKGVERTSWRTRVGLRFRGRWKGILLWSLLAPVIVVAISVLAVLVTAARGVPVDLSGSFWMRQNVDVLSEMTGIDIGPALVLAILVIQLGAGLVITLLATLGEEIGWRGWLWPALKPLGRIPAAVIGGIIWSLWHLPVVAIGYNYPGQPRYLAIPFFALVCCALFWLLGALTDRAGGNPIPAAVAHAAWNSWAGISLLVIAVPATAPALNLFLDTQGGIVAAGLTVLAGAAVMPWRRAQPIVHTTAHPPLVQDLSHR